MNARIQKPSIVVLLLCSTLAGWAGPKELETWREEFDAGTRRIDASLQTARAEMGDTYVTQLRRIGRELQAQGQIRSLVAIRDEADRFDKTRTPPATAMKEPPELRDTQLQFMARLQAISYSNELEVVRLGSRYLQAIAIRRADAETAGDADALHAWDTETTRVLGLPRLRQALKATETVPSDPLVAGEVRTAATAAQQWDYRSLRLYRPNTEDLTARINFELVSELGEDLSRLRIRKAVGGVTMSTSEEGVASYRVRTEIRANGTDLPSGHKIVLTYYSRSLVEHERQRETVEEIVLPAIARGQTYTAEGKGVDLYRSTANTTNMRGASGVSVQGREWYGVVIELRDSEDRVILQRFTPQSLEKEMR